MQRLAQRRQQLARRQEQHRGAVLSFDSFLKAVAARRERALRRAGEERARAAAERAEAARLQRELERLRRHRERLARRLRSLRPFGDYLRDALATMGQVSVGSCGATLRVPKPLGGVIPPALRPQPLPTAQFQDVPAMLVHFGVLAGVRAALAREAEAGQEQLTQGRAQLQRYRQESSTQLLGTRNELARLHARLEAARRDVLQWESCWTHIQSTAIQKTLLLGQIKLAVLNLFQQTTAQLRIPMDRAQEDTKAQLDMVSTTLSRGSGAGDTQGHLHPWMAVASISHLHSCCSACGPWLTSVPLAHTHSTTGVSGCFRGRNSPWGHLPAPGDGERLQGPAWSHRTCGDGGNSL
ncbi:Coiled-coil domain-containing protein 42A [Lonchura striata]|uniref:Coiled-coil domain-containing protein 42A n=1 Tax=Lonchura striata TaxID=40157 RepID=A0A218V2P4_9PASE|nr:Coiled-coil domain-containing protein 42A [Lonchura striata domestica]